MSDSPEVSVVIPTRSRWDLLARAALPSALAQEDVGHEVIVVDDGSTDQTAMRLAEVNDPRLSVVRHERSLGLSRARNTGIEAARGDWIAFLDDDDLWSPRKLSVQLDTARAEQASFVYGASVVLDEHLSVTQEHHPTDPAALLSRLRTQYAIPAGCSNVMVKAELVRRLGGFDENLWHLQDWDLWLRLAAEAKGAACPEILVGYIVHGRNSFQGDSAHDMMDDLGYLLRKHGTGPTSLEVDAASFRRWVAFRLRRAGKRRRAARTYLLSARLNREPRDVLLATYSLIDGPAADLLRRLLLARGQRPASEQPVREPTWLARYR